jgi:predicted nucleotidyltransferase
MKAQTQELYEAVAKELRDRLISELEQEIDAIILYGSVARREAHVESDIDILIISPDKMKTYDKASEIRYELDLKYGTMTTILVYTPEEFEQSLSLGSPFLKEVLKEGQALYGQQEFQAYRRALQAGRAVP